MHINPGGLLVLAGVAVALRFAPSSNGFMHPLLETTASVAALLTATNFFRHNR